LSGAVRQDCTIAITVVFVLIVSTRNDGVDAP
jgi:hypothetical protein